MGLKKGREKSGHVLPDITWGCGSVERGVWEIMKSNNQIVRWPYKKRARGLSLCEFSNLQQKGGIMLLLIRLYFYKIRGTCT